MPPVTRSTRRNLPTFLQEPSARQSTTSAPLRLSEPTRTGNPGLLDWICVTPALIWDHAKQTDAIDEFFDQLRGHSSVALRLQRSRSLEAPNTEYLMIEWSHASTRAKFIDSDNYTSLMDLLGRLTQGRSVHLALVDFSATTRQYAFHLDTRGPVDHFELLLVYFPRHLSEQQRRGITHCDRPFLLRGWFPGQPGVEIEPHPVYQLVDWTRGWLVYPPAVDFRGHRGAQCLVYFLRWNGRAGEKSYKSIRETHAVDWWGEFLGRLEELGMLGFESQHVQFYRRLH
ncbi:uncharacterized protein BO66DRAFT_469040 [Aspergillus aculeatinus CBS 121060]|uniref:Uncharacterized protein n=1 Tax=Aspergillus aculeatinus CBS 121060 TaxID=1448322 RepID=A0ACD1HHY0_9EURO|nr:hypothetical protein BO66DRAFT_469040 [Aspergillus aculeatinus CBS 121060]RAH73267.1 hypothetical protein BO66DRAFT_469040 [Aspergillus aculeatinus CBS 121060]